MDGRRFDGLTKALATGVSRRRVLRDVGGSVIGTILVGWGMRQASAAPGGNSAAATFCHTLFGDTRSAGQCTSQAAHGTGPYYECAGNTANYCSGACTNIQTDTNNCGSCGHVCPTGDTCTSGSCVSPCLANGGRCNGNPDCCSDVCQNHTCVATVAGTCPAGSDYCTTGVSNTCGNGLCFCFGTAEGTLCSSGFVCANSCDECDSITGPGSVCTTSGPHCCDQSTVVCLGPCPPVYP